MYQIFLLGGKAENVGFQSKTHSPQAFTLTPVYKFNRFSHRLRKLHFSNKFRG